MGFKIHTYVPIPTILCSLLYGTTSKLLGKSIKGDLRKVTSSMRVHEVTYPHGINTCMHGYFLGSHPLVTKFIIDIHDIQFAYLVSYNLKTFFVFLGEGPLIGDHCVNHL